jgi:hypothetical protein
MHPVPKRYSEQVQICLTKGKSLEAAGLQELAMSKRVVAGGTVGAPPEHGAAF